MGLSRITSSWFGVIMAPVAVEWRFTDNEILLKEVLLLISSRVLPVSSPAGILTLAKVVWSSTRVSAGQLANSCAGIRASNPVAPSGIIGSRRMERALRALACSSIAAEITA
ncbi:hypothetical protein D3C81_1462840 [compost metagenome]